MKKVEELKAGMEVWMKFCVDKGLNNMPFSVGTDGLLFCVYEDCRLYKGNPPLEMFTEEEIPELKGVEMEVSDDGLIWDKLKVLCKYKNEYISTDGNIWLFARPIQKTFDLTNVPEHLLTDELKQYLK